MPTKNKRRQYGTGAVYQRSDGRWFGVIEAGYHKNGKRRRITVSAKTEVLAKDRLKFRMRELDRGNLAADNRTTVKAWAERWLAMTEKTVRPNTHTADRAAAGWIIETIGHRRLDQLTPADVRSVALAIEAAGKSSSTAQRYHGTLSRMLKAAAAEGLPVAANVFIVETPSAAANDRQSIPTPEALAILKAATELPHASRWIAALLQGIRQGEALGLLWENVRDDSIVLSWQLQPLPYRDKKDRSKGFRVPRGYEARQLVGQLHLVRPKSKAGWRVIPLLPVMRDALEAWRAAAPPSPHGLVWPAADGAPANETDDRDEWVALQGEAMAGHPAGRWYFLHEARHTTATLLMEMGVPESVRVAIMGHSSVASTKAYEFVDTAEMRRALEMVAGRLELS